MPYTNNVPQGNQRISDTQPLIQANFGFIQTAINQEHNFDKDFPDKTYHLKASMPDMVDPVALPVGTNGIFYVSGGLPKFYNGTTYFLQTSSIIQNVLTGTVNIAKGSPSGFSMPPNSVGSYFLQPPSGFGAANVCAMGQFVTSTTSMSIGPVLDPTIDVTKTGLSIKFEPTNSVYNGTYTYTVVYYTP